MKNIKKITKVKVSPIDFLKVSVISGSKYKLMMILGFLCHRAMSLYVKSLEGRSRQQEGELSESAIESYRLLCEERLNSEVLSRQVPFTANEILNPLDWQAFGAKLLLETLQSYRDKIKSAINIGAYNDRHFSYMASLFPNINFVSIDFMSQPVMTAFNSSLPQNPNWSLRSGYPLEILRNGDVLCDLVFMSSTSLLFNNKELNLYLDTIATKAKVIVINEGWGIVSKGPNLSSFGFLPRIVLPEDISEDESVVRSMDGIYFSYGHNYPAKLESRGFQVMLSQIKASNNNAMYLYQLVAVRKTLLCETKE